MSSTASFAIPEDLYDAARRASRGNDADFKESAFFRRVSEIRARQGADVAREVTRELLARFLDEQQPRIAELNYPASVQELLSGEFARIRSLLSQLSGVFDLEEHSVRSDFRIVGFGRVPVGVEHMETRGVPRSLLYRGGLAQFGRFLRVVAQSRGVRPFYQTHLKHGVAPAHFLLVYTPRAQEQMLRRIAECLKMNPHIRGWTASSWWYDPQLARISPHLTFLRTGLTEKGARLFRYGPSQSHHAIANSSARRKLHEAGEYVPITYTMVWPRDCLIRWADSIPG